MSFISADELSFRCLRLTHSPLLPQLPPRSTTVTVLRGGAAVEAVVAGSKRVLPVTFVPDTYRPSSHDGARFQVDFVRGTLYR